MNVSASANYSQTGRLAPFSGGMALLCNLGGAVYVAWQEAVTEDNDEILVRRLP